MSSLSWPLGARAQQMERIRRIGVLVNLPADDSEAQARIGAFLQGLQEFDWAIGRNVRIEYRWAADAESLRRHAALLAGMAMASAQNVPSGGRDSGPAAQSQGVPGGAAGQDRQAPQSSQGQQGQDAKGQAQQGQKDQMQPGHQKDQAKSPSQTQQSPKQEQSPQRQQGQQGQGPQPGQGGQGKTTQQGQTQQGQTGGSGATLTTEQRTKIRDTGPRASNVNFSISVGTAVPRAVRVIAVPPTLVQWRGHRYFVVGDEMIIVDAIIELLRSSRFRSQHRNEVANRSVR